MSRTLAPAAMLAVAFAATLLVAPWSDTSVTDLPFRQAQAERIVAGEIPYRELAFEYPPLAAAVLAPAALVSEDRQGFEVALGLIALGGLALVAWQCARLADRSGGSPLAASVTAAASPLLLGAIVRTQFDVVPTAALAGGLALIARARAGSGMAWLGAGTMTKAFPLVGAATAAAWLWASRGRAAAVRGLAAMAAVVAVVTAVAVAFSFDGVVQAARYQLDRPAHVESAQASVLAAATAIGGGSLALTPARGSVALAAPASGAVGTAFALATLAALAAFAALAWRAGAAVADPVASRRGLLLAALGSVAALVAFGRVLSPQYMIWLVPLLALAVAWRHWWLAGVTAAAFGLTLAEFPSRYPEVAAGDPAALALVGARNLALVAIVAICLGLLLRLVRRGGASVPAAAVPAAAVAGAAGAGTPDAR